MIGIVVVTPLAALAIAVMCLVGVATMVSLHKSRDVMRRATFTTTDIIDNEPEETP